MQALTLTLILSTLPIALGYLFADSSSDAPKADRFVAGLYIWVVGAWLAVLYALPAMAQLSDNLGDVALMP